MSLKLIYHGNDKKNLYVEPEKEFIKRIKRYSKFEVIQINPEKYKKSTPINYIKSKEENAVVQKAGNDFILLLDEKGKNYSSIEFAHYLDKIRQSQNKISFIIGGAYGFSQNFKKEYKSISLSSFTMPHHLARLVFLEQLYRSFTILNNEPYHNT